MEQTWKHKLLNRAAFLAFLLVSDRSSAEPIRPTDVDPFSSAHIATMMVSAIVVVYYAFSA